MVYKILVLQVKELMELHLTIYQIADRLKVDPESVQAAIEVIQGWVV
jgi:DNA-binding CsgD family transcriptional regulator